MGRIVLLEITLPMFTPDQLESEFGKIKFEKKEGYLIEYIQK